LDINSIESFIIKYLDTTDEELNAILDSICRSEEERKAVEEKQKQSRMVTVGTQTLKRAPPLTRGPRKKKLPTVAKG